MYNKKMPIDLNCGVKVALEVIGGKWKSYIVFELSKGAMRPSELHKKLPGTSARVIDQQLKELLDYGVVARKVFDTIPKQSEYSLTEFGRTLLPVVTEMDKWGLKYKPVVERAIAKKNNL